MSYTAFVSTFPTEANMRDGYFRRVHCVDQALDDAYRIHLDIRFWKNGRKVIVRKDKNMKIMHLNAVLHFFIIHSILKKSGIIYVHTVAKIPSILFHLLILGKRVPFALDLHGVMIEEQQLARKPFKAWFYSGIERFSFNRSSLNVYVSEVMQSHFRSKYSSFKGDECIFATNAQPATSNPQPATSNPQPATRNPNDVIILYSGNCQPWQKIELMLETMQKLTAPNIKILILSGQKKHFEKLIRQRNFPEGKVEVISVKPEELESYYEMAHYGFILRDDILVNRVANPTKLAEYLQYGIIPIVKLVDIGDYARFDYEYIPYLDLNSELTPRKSQKNRDIYKEISLKYGSKPLQDSISRIQNRYMTPNKA
jgi:hypothetical protein